MTKVNKNKKIMLFNNLFFFWKKEEGDANVFYKNVPTRPLFYFRSFQTQIFQKKTEDFNRDSNSDPPS